MAAMARERYEIEGAMLLARQFLRDEQKCRNTIMQAVGRPTFAEECLYSFPRGGQTVEGASVKMAREMSRIWGNIRSGFRVITMDQDAQEVHVAGFAFDLQTNAYRTEEGKVRTRIFRKGKGWIDLLSDDIGGDTERQLSELVGRVGSKLERNCLLRLLPYDLVDQAIEHVKIVQAQGKVDPEKLRNLIAYFSGRGVSTLKLERYLGVRLRDMSGDDLAKLRRVAKSLQDGESSTSEFFPDDDAPPAHPPKQAEVTQPSPSPEPEPEPEQPAEPEGGECEKHGPHIEPECPECSAADEVDEEEALGDLPRTPRVWNNKQRPPKNAEPGDMWDKPGDDAIKVLDHSGEWTVAADPAAASERIIREAFAQKQGDKKPAPEAGDEKQSKAEAEHQQQESASGRWTIFCMETWPANPTPDCWYIRESDGAVFQWKDETWIPADATQLRNHLAERIARVAQKRKMDKEAVLKVIEAQTGSRPKGLLALSAAELLAVLHDCEGAQ